MLEKIIQKSAIYFLLILAISQPLSLSASICAEVDRQKLVDNASQGLLIVVSAPSGTGKTTLVEMLIKEFPNKVVTNISYTTREPRQGEISGVHYHFIGEAEFEEKIAKREFLEFVKLYGSYYGTSKKEIWEQQKLGKHVILVIDTQGALQIKDKIDAKYIFICPPSLEALRERLTKRGTEDNEVIEKRLALAAKEIDASRQYDYQVINNDLETAYRQLRDILIFEETKAKSAECILQKY